MRRSQPALLGILVMLGFCLMVGPAAAAPGRPASGPFVLFPSGGAVLPLPALTAALGQAPETSFCLPSTAPMRRVGGTGRIPLGRGPAGSFKQSSNWAGYDVTSDIHSIVQASWIQPALSPDSPNNSWSSFWVGLDGDGNGSVEQTGTGAYALNGSINYYAWYEMYPAAPVVIYGLTISPGDHMSAKVETNLQGTYWLTLTDVTTNTSYQTAQNGPYGNPCSAEIIAEAPTSASTGSICTLPDFGTVTFTNCAMLDLPLSTFHWYRIDLISGSGSLLAATYDLGTDGASFSVSTGGVPRTTVFGSDALWHRRPVTLTFRATEDAGGPGVAYTEHAVDGAGWVLGNSVTIGAPTDHSRDGIHTVRYRSVDRMGVVELTRSCRVRIDTRGPACKAYNATVKQGQTCRLYYYFKHPWSDVANLVLEIRTQSSVLKTRIAIGPCTMPPAPYVPWVNYQCKLPRGTYLLRLYGTDLAGNAQTVIGRAYLIVK
jgi:hypothetical protein